MRAFRKVSVYAGEFCDDSQNLSRIFIVRSMQETSKLGAILGNGRRERWNFKQQTNENVTV